VLLTALRRAAQTNPAGVTAVEQGIALGALDRESGAISEVEARIIEGSAPHLQAHPVQPATQSGFTSFLDGIQHAEVRLYRGPVPIVYAYGAAVVRARVQGRMLVHERGLLDEREAVFFPFRHLNPDDVQALGVAREQMIDSSPPAEQPSPLFPPLLYNQAARAVDHWREGIERNVARQWCAEAHEHDWLLVDGPLTLSPELASARRAVGLIRSQRTRFFDAEDAHVIARLRVGERTSLFEPLTRRWTPVHSWYLRLRDPLGHDVFWGLVRVEIAARPGSERAARQVSSWLLAEASPLALPGAGWDRLLYPLHDCQRFLRARAPTLRG
jgi:hypothetical protein